MPAHTEDPSAESDAWRNVPGDRATYLRWRSETEIHAWRLLFGVATGLIELLGFAVAFVGVGLVSAALTFDEMVPDAALMAFNPTVIFAIVGLLLCGAALVLLALARRRSARGLRQVTELDGAWQPGPEPLVTSGLPLQMLQPRDAVSVAHLDRILFPNREANQPVLVSAGRFFAGVFLQLAETGWRWSFLVAAVLIAMNAQESGQIAVPLAIFYGVIWCGMAPTLVTARRYSNRQRRDVRLRFLEAQALLDRGDLSGYSEFEPSGTRPLTRVGERIVADPQMLPRQARPRNYVTPDQVDPEA